MTAIYWTTTTLLSAFLLYSAYSYLFVQNAIEGVRAIGFPDFFRIQLAILKSIAAIIIMMPPLPLFIKEWAYVGIILFQITAIVAHAAHRDPLILNVINIIITAFVLISRYSLYKIGQ